MTELATASLSPADVDRYHVEGYLFRPSTFTPDEVDVLDRAAQADLDTEGPRRTVEESTGRPYRAHGSHRHSEILARLVRTPRMLGTARRLLADDVYVHQFKINDKRAYGGGEWKWHQDFIFWHREDGMPAPRAVTAAVFLDDVTEFNGPLTVVPGGHRGGLVELPAKRAGWADTLTSDLKYSLEGTAEMTELVRRHGLAAPKGPRGSVVWFDCNLPHGSAQNMSPFGRRVLFVSYNSVSNALPAPSPRPSFLVADTFDALAEGSDELA